MHHVVSIIFLYIRAVNLRRVRQSGDESHNITVAETVPFHVVTHQVQASHPVAYTTAIQFGVIAPGAATMRNKAFYDFLGLKARTSSGESFQVDIKGRTGMPYDAYPPGWSNGRAPPNLESFAKSCYMSGWPKTKDMLLLGSRGGQAALPMFWKMATEFGDELPPTILVNGGPTAQDTPTPGALKDIWPPKAVTLAVLGGEDYFTGSYFDKRITSDQYLEQVQNRIPRSSTSTAILLIREMQHEPDAAMMMLMVPIATEALLLWKAYPESPPKEQFSLIANTLAQDRWSGCLSWRNGKSWTVLKFNMEAPVPKVLHQAAPLGLPKQASHGLHAHPSLQPQVAATVVQRHPTALEAPGAHAISTFAVGTKVWLHGLLKGVVKGYDANNDAYDLWADDGAEVTAIYPKCDRRSVTFRQE